MAIEKPDYSVVESADAIEIRRYAPMNVARTHVEGNFEDVGSIAFRRLAGYIFGDNREERKIAMTAPVSQYRSDSHDGYWITFMMPAEYPIEDLPGPLDGQVELVGLPGQTMAAISYRGGWSEQSYREHEATLRAWIDGSSQWEASGPAIWARYDPPIMPTFLRRNEILLPVRDKT